MNRMQKVLISGACIVGVGFGFIAFSIGAKPADSVQLTPIAAAEAYHPDAYAKAYPLQYKSYMKNKVMSAGPTGYGTSIKYQHFDKEPANKINFKGYGFSIDYEEDRGHAYALEDIAGTKRINDKSKGACITCKTPYLEKFYAEMGWKYAAAPFAEIAAQVPEDGYISCANCHDPSTMELRVINPALTEALERQGKDIKDATHNEMRSYTCGQCHVEYYMDQDARVVFPWDKGLKPDEMYAYYAQKPNGFEQDYIQPDSKVKVIKAQHPDFETWSTSIHAENGVTCIDCHMPYMRENGQKYTSHWMTSPLKTPKESCGKCHGEDTDRLIARVKTIQDHTFQIQFMAGETVAKAHEAVKAASEQPNVDQAELEKARELTRRAQWYWDYTSAENGMGFHNVDQVMNTLGQSIDLAHQAIESANKAAKGSVI